MAIQPLLQSSKAEYGMFDHFKRYPWVLPIFKYEGIENLQVTLEEKVIQPFEIKAKELTNKKY